MSMGREGGKLVADEGVPEGMSAFAIAPSALLDQAMVAEKYGNSRLAANLRRAAELAALSDQEVLECYNLLRPGRAMPDEIRDVAAGLEQRGLPLCAEYMREAARVYEECGLA